MALKFKARQSTLETEDGRKLWYPILVKDSGTITSQHIAKKIAEKSSLTPGDVYNVINCLISEMNDKLMNGHSVRLDELGTFTTRIKASGKGVEKPEDVSSSQIKTLRIQFTPTSKRTPMQGTTRALFEGVEFKRWIADPYNPQYKKPDNTGDDDDDYVDPEL